MKKHFYIFFLIFLVTLSAWSEQKDKKTITINDKIIKVEIADTPALRSQGLSGREKLDPDRGMLFKFNSKKERTFLMRNMNFGLDIIWIEDDKIIGIDKNLVPEGRHYRNRYTSPAPVNYVLEVNAGFTDKYNIKTGDTVNYSL